MAVAMVEAKLACPKICLLMQAANKAAHKTAEPHPHHQRDLQKLSHKVMEASLQPPVTEES